MTQRIRIRCPVCNMMPYLECVENGPYPIRVILQTFGGKVSGEKKGKGSGKGSAPGMMKYRDITNTKEGRRVLDTIKKLLE